MSSTTGPVPAPPVTQERGFWVQMGYAGALGVFGAVAALVFLGVVKVGGKWYSDTNPGWLGGHWWWIAVTAAAGVVVGLLRLLTRLPEQTPGLIPELQDQHVDWRLVPGIVAVSAASLIGGASLGPEKALGAAGGGAGSWVANRRGLGKEGSQVNTMSGFAGAGTRRRQSRPSAPDAATRRSRKGAGRNPGQRASEEAPSSLRAAIPHPALSLSDRSRACAGPGERSSAPSTGVRNGGVSRPQAGAITKGDWRRPPPRGCGVGRQLGAAGQRWLPAGYLA